MDRYDLVSSGDEWKLQKKGAERAAKVFDSKQEGMRESIEFMRNHGGSLRIHKQDGKIQEERTYPRSADPKKTPG